MKSVTVAQLIDYLQQFSGRTTVMDGTEDRPYNSRSFVDLSIALDALASPEETTNA